MISPRFQAPDPHLAAQIAALQHRFGQVDVIENQTIAIPGSINTYDLRAQNPRGAFGQPMLSLVSGHYPAGPGQVAVTGGVASAFNLKIGDLWRQGGTARRVVGIVENPQSLLDEFALVVPGQVRKPTQVTLLFDAPGVGPGLPRPERQDAARQSAQGNPLNPETIALALATVGMLLIALVGVGGFTVLAQRRLRSLGMLASLGATDKHIRLVVRANGVVVGISGALTGAALGMAAWLAYRPRLEASAHHLIGVLQLPWLVIVVAMVLAVLATFVAASRPARDHQGDHRDRPVREARAAQAGAPLGPPRRCPPGGRGAVAVVLRQHKRQRRRGRRPSWFSASWPSSRRCCCCPRCAWPCWAGSAGVHRSRCAWPCATWPATGRGRAQPWLRSALAC